MARCPECYEPILSGMTSCPSCGLPVRPRSGGLDGSAPDPGPHTDPRIRRAAVAREASDLEGALLQALEGPAAKTEPPPPPAPPPLERGGRPAGQPRERPLEEAVEQVLHRAQPEKVELPAPPGWGRPGPAAAEGGKGGTPEKPPPPFEAQAARYDRKYAGRSGWSPGAVWDSLVYVARLVASGFRRRIAMRKARKESEKHETLMEERLVGLGRTALFLDGFTPKMIEEFHQRLLKLEARGAQLEQEVRGITGEGTEVQQQYKQKEKELADRNQEIEEARKGVERELEPLESKHRAALQKIEKAEYRVQHLGRQMEYSKEELGRLNASRAPIGQISKLRSKISRWSAEKKVTEQQLPEYLAEAERLEPDIDRLRSKLETIMEEQDAFKAKMHEVEMEKRQALGQLQQKKGKVQYGLEEIEKYKDTVFRECGEALAWNRPEHPVLSARYGELDAITAEKNRLEDLANALKHPPGKMSWQPLFRAFVVFAALALVVLLIIKLV